MSLNTMSATQAVLAMYIIDTEIYGQTRILPLSMQKKYQRQLALYKKMQVAYSIQAPVVSEQSIVTTNVCNSISDETSCTNGDADQTSSETPSVSEESIVSPSVRNSISDDNSATEQTSSEMTNEGCDMDTQFNSDEVLLLETELEKELPNIEEIGSQITEAKQKKKLNLHHALPSPKSVRSAHHVISAYLEGKIGEEMLREGKSYLMPDGTSRQRLGRMGASLVKVGEKFRALRVLKMGNETRDN